MAGEDKGRSTAAEDGMLGAPSTQQANRAARQGAGMGQREIDAQQDPGSTPSNAAAPGEPSADESDDAGQGDNRDGDGL